MKEWAKRLSFASGDPELFAIAERIEQVAANQKGLFPNLDFLQRPRLPLLWCADGDVHAIFCFVANRRLVGTPSRTACSQ